MNFQQQEEVLSHPELTSTIDKVIAGGLSQVDVNAIIDKEIGKIGNEATGQIVTILKGCLLAALAKKSKEKGTTWAGRAWRNLFGWLKFPS